MKLNYRHTFALMAVVLAMGAHSLLAQGPGEAMTPPDPATMAQHRVQFLTNQLSLTAQQQQQALTIYTSAATSQGSVHESMKAAHDSLRTAVKNNDANGIAQASNTIGNLTAQATATEAKADAALYTILTPDQQTKLTEMEARGPGMHLRGPGHLPPDHP